MHKNRISVHIIFALLEKDRRLHYFTTKVEKILKRILDSIPSPSPSVKIHMMGGKVCLRKANHCQETFENKKFVDITQQCLTLLPQVNFPTEGEGDGIESRLSS